VYEGRNPGDEEREREGTFFFDGIILILGTCGSVQHGVCGVYVLVSKAGSVCRKEDATTGETNGPGGGLLLITVMRATKTVHIDHVRWCLGRADMNMV